MNTYLTKKRLVPTLALACLAPLISQNAQAAATFSSSATVTYAINSLVNSTNAGDFSGLGIAGSFDLVPGQDYQTITGNGSVTPSLTNSGTTALPPTIGSSYSRTFQLDGAANKGGVVTANYLAGFWMGFNNSSATDSYNVGLTLTYQLSANASGDDAFTDVLVNYYNKDQTFNNFNAPGYISASTQALGSAFVQSSRTFNFNLAPEGSETLAVDAGLTGTLQASPVPLPSGIWLFATALMAIPGIRKSKSAA